MRYHSNRSTLALYIALIALVISIIDFILITTK